MSGKDKLRRFAAVKEFDNFYEPVLKEPFPLKGNWNRDHFKNDINHDSSINYIYKRNNELKGYLFGYLVKDEYYLNKITVKKNIDKKMENYYFYIV